MERTPGRRDPSDGQKTLVLLCQSAAPFCHCKSRKTSPSASAASAVSIIFGVAAHLPEQRGVGLPQVLRQGVVLGQHFPELRDHGLRVQRLRLRGVLCGKQTLRLAQARCAFSACRSRLRQTAQCASTLRTAPVRKAASRRSATCCSSVASRSSAAPLRVWARCSAVARFAACRL